MGTVNRPNGSSSEMTAMCNGYAGRTGWHQLPHMGREGRTHATQDAIYGIPEGCGGRWTCAESMINVLAWYATQLAFGSFPRVNVSQNVIRQPRTRVADAQRH